MKKLFYLAVLLLISISSCTNILDVQPTESISADEAIKDQKGVERALIGCYSGLQSIGMYGRNQVLVQDLAADNLVWTGTTMDYSQIAENLIPSNNAVTEGIWAANYDLINRANNVLAKLPEIGDLTEAERKEYEGHALFLRSLCYFNLVTYYGGVPLKIQPTVDLSNINQARNTVEEVYNQIFSDLNSAINELSETTIIGLASAFSARALLARASLTYFHITANKEYADLAVAEADYVINNGGFSLAPSYADLFTGNMTESIFEVIYDPQNSNRLAQYFYPRSLTGRYEASPGASIIESFTIADSVRFTTSIAYDENNLPYGYKYRDILSGTDRVYVFRLAEMFLIKAEALAYTNGSIEDIRNNINIIRERAGLEATTASDYSELQLVILNERRHEFAFECQRWSDLVRTKTATIVLGIDPKYTLFPIPLSEMQTNKLMSQNPGY